MTRNTFIAASVLVSAALVGAPSPRAQSSLPNNTKPAAAASAITVPAGEKLVLQLETPLHTRSTRQGERAQFRTSTDVLVGNQLAIPRGTPVEATVTKVQRPGRVAGRAEIELHFNDVTLADGTRLPLRVTILRAGMTQIGTNQQGEPRLKGEGGNTNVASIVSGGVQGAMVGVLTGGVRGAAVGGAVGAGIGLAGVLLKRGPELDLPPNMLFELRFDRALEVPAAAAQRAAEIARNTAPSPRAREFRSLPMIRIVRPIRLRPSVRACPVDPTWRGMAARPDVTTGDSTPADPDRGRGAPPVMSRGGAPPVDVASGPAPTLPRDTVPAPSTPSARLPAPPADSSAGGDPGVFKISVAVQLVQVDAVVRDRSGVAMDRLRREDFRLMEDGVEQQIYSFSRDETPLAVALVVDRSGSVAPYMHELRDAAYRSLMQLKRGDEVALFSFAGEVERLEDLTADRQRVANRIATIRAGGANIGDALFDAVYYLSAVAPDRRRVVILVSDNVATTKPRANEGQTIRMAMESETVIYSVKTPGEGTPLTMRIPNWLGGNGSVSTVVHETGGEMIDVQTTGSLDSALATVITRLRLRYTLGYYPSNTERNGAFRKIDLRLVERFGRPVQDYSVQARRGYYPPGTPGAIQARH